MNNLDTRLGGLRAFVSSTEDHLPAALLAGARDVLTRAGERLALSRYHTVVALAGATGSGKSSLFNALAGADLSPAGVLRPTTGLPSAAVWGYDGAGPLLDWLAVPPGRRHDARSTEDSGLVLLDLPDFDSVEDAHRIEVDRLLTLVDVMVWVLDPEKYADQVVHEQYLARYAHHRDITVVALNQADRLNPADLDRCMTDLRGLLTEDGLGGVPVIATSAVAPPGVAPLRAELDKAAAARRAALARLSADVDTVVDGLSPLVSPANPRVESAGLVDALANAAGVPVVVAATSRAYVHRGVRATGWPYSRWLRRLRPDPLGRLHLDAGATSIAPAGAAADATVGLALRTVAQRSSTGLPDPWPEAVLAAARSRSGDLPDALDRAVARTDIGMSRRPRWWSFIGALQWLFALVVLAGLVWLGIRYALFALALPEPPAPKAGRLPLPTLMFLGGLLAGLLLSVLARPVLRAAGRRKGRRAGNRLRANIRVVADELVLAPVNAVLAAYSAARVAFRTARG